MSDLYTIVEDKFGNAHISDGRVSRDKAIAEATLYWKYQLKCAQEFLSFMPDELDVNVVRGLYKQKSVGKL